MLYINVPYSEKEEAKKLGARWNPVVRKWYIKSSLENYRTFARWIMREDDGDEMIVRNHLYIIEGKQTCWRCGKETKVIGLGIGERVHMYGDQNNPTIEEIGINNGICLAWTEQESEIPPKLLDYMCNHYYVKVQYSKTTQSLCFANYCSHCNALQGNWYLFHEESPLSPFAEGDELADCMRALTIKRISLDCELILDWEYELSENNIALLRYGKMEDVNLSDEPNKERISYEELYNLNVK